jgi:hypothetical protein
MRKNLFFLFLLVFSTKVFIGQDLTIQWSKKINYDRKSFGELQNFIGYNSKYVYAMFYPSISKMKTSRTLVAFDKNTMQQVGKVSINSKSEFRKALVVEDCVYVLTADDTKGKETMFGQTYTPTLSSLGARKKIFSLTTSSKGSSRNVESLDALVNIKANNSLYIIGEKDVEKGQKLKFNYALFDNTLTQLKDGTITLPVEKTDRSIGRKSYYGIGEDGTITVKNYIRMERAQRKEENIGAMSYAMLSIIDPNTANISSLPIKAKDKHIVDFESYVRNGKLNVVGFYTETIGKRSERGSGIFASVLNTTTNELENTQFIESNAAVTFSMLYLEKMKIHDDGTMTMYATEDDNYTVTHVSRSANGATTTRTEYYNRKGDLLIVHLSPTLEKLWERRIERNVTYSGWYVRDVSTMANAENTYVTYGDWKSRSKNRFSISNRAQRKSMSQVSKEWRESIMYATVNLEDGKANRRELKLNKSGTDKKQKRYADISGIRELDDQLYVDGFVKNIKTGVKVGCALLSIPTCGCGGWVYMLAKQINGSAFEGGGSLGVIKVK